MYNCSERVQTSKFSVGESRVVENPIHIASVLSGPAGGVNWALQ